MHKGTLTNWVGVGIFATENIPIKVCHEFDLNIPDCEDIWVQIELEHGKKGVIGIIYRHPKQNLNRFHLSFEKVLELLSCKNVTYYIGGDFNINFLQNENKVKAYIGMTYSLGAVADPENFGGGGFEAQNLKNSDVFTKIESDFSAAIGNSNDFFAQIQVVSKKKKKKKRSSPKLRVIFRPKSEIQTFFSPKFRWSPKKKKKEKGLHQNWDWFFAGLVRLGRWGGMHPEMEPNYSKQRLIFRPKSLLLGWWGGMHPPIPPLNLPLLRSYSTHYSSY